MARTRASVAAKVSSGKSSKAQCSVARPPPTGGSTGSSEKTPRSGGGGNPVCPRETPKWQHPITRFFTNLDDGRKDSEDKPGTSKRAPKRNVIHSSDDETEKESPPKNKELDESIVLEPLTGENSHKLEEYYEKGRGKGVGKKTKISAKEKDAVNKDSNYMEVDIEDIGETEKDVTEKEGSSASETENTEEKENLNDNANDSKKKGDEISNIEPRKRSRADIQEESNVSKKVKLH